MIGAVNFNGKFRGIPISAKQIDNSLIEINVDNNLIPFKKGDTNRVIKLLQSIINNKLNDNAIQKGKNNTSIKKFVSSLELEFKNIKSMPVKKTAPKKAVAKKLVAPRKKAVAKKSVAPRKKAVAKKSVAPRKKAVARKKVNISYENSWGKFLDSNKQALARGKRLSKPQYYADGSLRSEGGKIYYENRLNHADIKQKAKRGQMLGKITGLPTAKDIDSMREIELWAKNDSKLYYSQRLPILKNLYKKYKKDMYDVSKATKLYRYFIDSAMRSYHKEFGSKNDNWYDLLSTNDRQILAQEFAIETLEEFQNGEVYI